MTPEDVKVTLDQMVEEGGEEVYFSDGFDAALVGIARRCGQPPLAVYSYQHAVSILKSRDGMTEEDAVEWMEYNVVGAWFGEGTPIWLTYEVQ